MTREASRLHELLIQCMNLLRSVDEAFWSGRIESMLEQDNTLFIARSILAWYGGMGSFSDLMICRMNGHNVKPEDESQINERLSALRTEIYEEAEASILED